LVAVAEWDLDEGSEAFEIAGNFLITAVNLANETFTYSRLLDHYQYRVIKKVDGKWQESMRGPYIDRRVSENKVFLCTRLQYIQMDYLLPKLVVTSVRGRAQQELNAVVEFHRIQNETEWAVKQRVFEGAIPLSYTPNVYNTDSFS
jgi:hypothetical protein